MDGNEIYERFASSRGANGLTAAQDLLKAAAEMYREVAEEVQHEAATFEEYWDGDAAGAAMRGLGPAAVESTRAAEQSTTAEDLLRRQAESYEFAKRNVRPVPPMPTQPPSLAEVVANPSGENSYFAQAQASQEAARNNIEQANVFQTSSNYNEQMLPASFGNIDAGKFDINTSADSSAGPRASVGGVGGADPAVGAAAVAPSGSAASASSTGRSGSTSGAGSGSAGRVGSGAIGSTPDTTRPAATAPAASGGPVPGTIPPGAGRPGQPGPSGRIAGGTVPPLGGGVGAVTTGAPGGAPGAGGVRGGAPGAGGALRGGVPGGGQPGGRMTGQLPGGGAGQAGPAGRAGAMGGRAGMGPGMAGGPGAGRGKGDDDSEHRNKFAQLEQLPDGVPREKDEYGERTIDEQSGHTVVPPVIGEHQPEQPQPAGEQKTTPGSGATPTARSAAAGSSNPHIPPSGGPKPKQS